MIVFDLICDESHTFEGWFASSGDFEQQCAEGLVSCPICGSEAVTKAPMAPAVPTKSNARDALPSTQNADSADSADKIEAEKTASAHPVANQPMPPAVAQAFAELAKAQAKALEKSEYVGSKFAEEARSMHYGEKDAAPIHGHATRKEAEDLVDEGVAVAPLIVPVSPPEELN